MNVRSSAPEREVIEPAFERNLLRRALVDPTTGFPNTLYLDLLRSWETAVASRTGHVLCLLTITFDGGTAMLCRALMTQLAFAIRASDVLATDGLCCIHLLMPFRLPSDRLFIEARISQLADRLNAQYADIRPLVTHVSAPIIELDRREARSVSQV